MQAKVVFCQMCLRLSYFIHPSKPITVNTGNLGGKKEKKSRGMEVFHISVIMLGIKKKLERKEVGFRQNILLLSTAPTSLHTRSAGSQRAPAVRRGKGANVKLVQMLRKCGLKEEPCGKKQASVILSVI